MMAQLDDAVLRLHGVLYSGSGDWLDESGNGHDYTPVGSPTHDGTKWTLDGSSQYLEANAAHADFTWAQGDDFTILVRFDCAVGTAGKVLWGTGAFNTNNTTLLYVFADDRMRGWLRDNSATTIADYSAAAGAPAPGNVRYAAMVRDSAGDDDIEVFVDAANSDGATTDTTTDTVTNLDYPYRIGNTAAGAAAYLEGDVYDVVIWNRALTSAQLATVETEVEALGASPTITLLGA